MRQTIVLNLYGGPGCGKSTTAAGIYHELKQRGESVELVREYVKNWAWRGYKIDQTWDQPYLFAKQLRAESAVYGKVDTIVTDSPLGLCMVYEDLYSGMPKEWSLARPLYHRILCHQTHHGIHSLNILVVRHKEYVPEGRYETKEQAVKVDDACRSLIPNLIPIHGVGDALDELSKFRKQLTNQ